MLGHILKSHVPIDRVPLSCSLCRFGCQDRHTLVDHILKYRRHADAEAKLTSFPNFADILKKAEDPYLVGDHDTVMLSREESLQWWQARCQPLGMEEDPFHEEDEYNEEAVVVRAGRAFPSWAYENNTLQGRPLPVCYTNKPEEP